MIKSRTHATRIVLDYMNSLIGTFRAGGFSADLTHQVMPPSAAEGGDSPSKSSPPHHPQTRT
jgi:hypothetical protein